MVVTDAAGVIRDLNDAAAALFETPRAQLLRQELPNLFSSEANRSAVRQCLALAVGTAPKRRHPD